MTTYEPLPVTAWKRHVQRKISAWNAEAFELQQKILDAQLALGDVAILSCAICKAPVPWSGHGKPSRYCPKCRREKRLRYMKDWRLKNRSHATSYMRVYRRRLRKRILSVPDENLGDSGCYHYRNERRESCFEDD